MITLIPGFLDIVHAENPGAAFSILRDFEYRHLLFLGFAIIAFGIVWDQFRRLTEEHTLLVFALALIASGAAGNAMDRLYKRTVTDFIRVYTEQPSIKATLIDWFGTYEWPSFNVADSALLVGVLIFVFKAPNPEEETAKPLSPSPET